ncbi:hypothetical protein AVEN_66647-1 [Araneus ventricosus]|uniref:Uncharacterized protein n=1 Tax=Araneus ventricosus TaxID=182803 RepID=A0A4Y2RBH1_ARAVE|nr:hypothetical protein AVEN_118421-1 [Araneus ventricosus]GBN73011.1 hypothetical protein AVEN_66647-1 [Araneus ventricosus]
MQDKSGKRIGNTGRSTFNILSKVSLQPSNLKRKDTLFFPSHGPFPSYLHSFNLAPTAYCPCGNLDATPLHRNRMYLDFFFPHDHANSSTRDSLVPQVLPPARDPD